MPPDGEDATKSPETQESDFMEHRRQMAEFEFGAMHDRARRAAISAQHRRGLLETVADANGIALGDIDKLHEKDWAFVQRQADGRRPSVKKLLKAHHTRQRAAFKTVAEYRDRFEYQGGNPVFQACLWRASSAVTAAQFPFTFNQGTAGLEPPAAEFPPPTTGNNLIRFTVAARANAAGSLDRGLTPVAGLELLTSHVFDTVARADGLLSVTTHYAPLGEVFLGAPGDCVGFGGSATFSLTLLMEVRIAPPGRFGFTVPGDNVREIVNARVHAGCDAETQQILVGPTGGESYTLSNPDLARVASGDAIRITARYAMRVSAAIRGVAIANFSGAPSGLNVPVVTTKIVT